MPKGTRVYDCVQDVKAKGGSAGGNPYAICQASTRQSYATGKPLKKKKPGKPRSVSKRNRTIGRIAKRVSNTYA